MGNTNLYSLWGESHVRGPAYGAAVPLVLGPSQQIIRTLGAPSPPAQVGSVVEGSTSGARGMVVRIVNATTYVIEPTNIAVSGWSSALPFGETVTFDPDMTGFGGTSVLSPLSDNQKWVGEKQFLKDLGNPALVGRYPADLQDTPWYDARAKKAQKATCAAGSVTGLISKGDVIGTSSGGEFTVKYTALDGSGDLEIYMVRKEGTIAQGDTLTGITQTFGATLTTLHADPPVGAWIPYSPIPNEDGTGLDWEVEPQGNMIGGSGEPNVGPENKLIRSIGDFHSADADPLERGSRLVAFDTWNEDFTGNTQDSGGVTLQTVRYTGITGVWQSGETVTAPGGWQGEVHAYNAGLGELFVINTNGETLGNELMTGSTSGATATAQGPAFGWQKGSKYWNDAFARVAEALAADGSEFNSQEVAWRGLALMIWETELIVHAQVTHNAPFVDQATFTAQWVKFIGDLREEIGVADLPIVLWAGHQSAKLGVVEVVPGVPYAWFLVNYLKALPKSIGSLRVADSDTLSDSGDGHMQTLDYLDLGERFWSLIRWGQIEARATDYEELPVGIFMASQSQAVGGITSTLITALDKDPDLWKSNNFSDELSTVDPNFLNWNFWTETLEAYQIESANTFWVVPRNNCGPECPLGVRMSRRFSSDPTLTSRFALFKAALGGTSINAAQPGGGHTWDPALASQPSLSTSITVTPVTGLGLPDRARLEGADGTFAGWEVGNVMQVDGSALGDQEAGGNNTPQFSANRIVAKGPDDDWIEITGGETYVGVAEGPLTLTLSLGPVPLWPEVVRQWRLFVQACMTAGFVPRPVFILQEQGEADLARWTEYKAALDRLWDAAIELFSLRLKEEQPIAKCITQLHSQTPWGTDEQVEGIRSAQAAKVAEMSNAVLVDPSDLAMEINENGDVIRTTRQMNGVHMTSRAMITKGFMYDEALGSLVGIPAHPDGVAATEYGAVGGGTDTTGADAEVDGVDGGSDSVEASSGSSGSDSASAGTAAAIADAMALQPDVASYSENRDGRTVTRRSLQDQIAAQQWLRAEQAAAEGFTHTLADFNE